jgi:signal transduction histidine kinase
MTEAAIDDSRRALAGLLEATTEAPAGPEGIVLLLGVLARVLAMECAVLEVVDESSGSVSVVATVGAAALVESSGLAAVVMAADREIDFDAVDADSLLPESLRRAGYRYAFGMPLGAQGRPLAVAWVAGSRPPAGTPECRHAARVAAERVGWIVERGRLYASLERAMAQILQSDERMLGRIGLDIHDGPTQHLSVALLEVQLLEAELNDAEAAGTTLPGVLRPALGRIYETLGGALHEMRELIGHLRPAQFESRRLDEILRDAMVAHESRTGNPVDADVRGEFAESDVSLTQKITFYRILQEALNNAHRHGHARNVRVSLVQDLAGIRLEVADDGGGFDPDAAQRPRPGVPQARYGLVGMRDRTQLLGGTFEVESAEGEGTVLRVYLPKWTPQDASGSGVVRA